MEGGVMDIVERLRNEPELTPAQYWEAQADMWHQNYKEATNEVKWLRWALRKIRGGLGDPSRNNMLPHEIARDALDGKW